MLILLGAIAAIVVFLWLKNKQANRITDRHNRLLEKQEELMEMLKEKNDKQDDN